MLDNNQQDFKIGDLNFVKIWIFLTNLKLWIVSAISQRQTQNGIIVLDYVILYSLNVFELGMLIIVTEPFYT